MVRTPQGAWVLTTDQVGDVDRRGAVWIYVQHEFERVCVCVCMEMTCVSLCNRVCHTRMGSRTRFLLAVQSLRAGGINTGSIPGSFASPSRLQDNLCSWVEKKRLPFGQSQQNKSKQGRKKSPWSQYQFWKFQLKIKHKKRWRSSIWNISLQHNKKTRSCYCFYVPNHVPEFQKKKKLIHLSLVTAACCSTWQMCGHICPSVCGFSSVFPCSLIIYSLRENIPLSFTFSLLWDLWRQ